MRAGNPFSPTIRVSLAVTVLCSIGHSQTLLDELTNSGIEFLDEVRVKLPPPTLHGELSNEHLESAKTQLAGNDGWERFSRDSVVAPVTIKLEYVTDKNGKRVGHNVHSAFVVHANLESLTDKELMQQIFGKPESNGGAGIQFTELTASDLKDAGVESLASEEATSLTYSRVEFTLLEKINLQGVMRIERTSTPVSTTICWMFDPKFAENEKLRGTWSKLGEDSQERKPYQGWGGYLNVTRVSESPEMVLIESRMLLHELPEWFSASNFVRSKLPLAIQEGARNFRRKLKSR